MFIDKVTLKIKAGDGGDGVVRWRREKGIPFGGPAGGDGGDGADVYLRVVRDINALSTYRYKSNFEGDKGENGQKRGMFGKGAKDLILDVPVGSIVYNREYDIKYECLKDGEIFKILTGGKGGLGNENFKSAVNRTPQEFTYGGTGQSATFDIELQLIADVGIIGKPNAGKSSFLNAITRAGAKVGNYAFTTLEPNLGAFYGHVLADIPGLIEGASEGKGLGHKFLRHIKRTNTLLHLVAANEESICAAYSEIRKELGNFDKELLDKKEIIVISKTDEINFEELSKKQKELEKFSGKKVLTMSLFDDSSIKFVTDYLFNLSAK